jgi:threonine dehydrogenase-like Zn-dependent dehydrogenase
MKATIYLGAHDVRVETVSDPVMRAAICGSDLWFYRGVTQLTPGAHTGHEFVGIVEAVGGDVHSVRPGDLVIAPFAWSDGTCEFCHLGLQTSCVHGGFFGSQENGGQAELVLVPYADGTLVKMPEAIAHDAGKHNASVTLSDVMSTGHHGVVSAQTVPGSTVVVVGDGAVGLCGVLSAAKELRAERIIAVGHNSKRLEIAKQFGATHTFDSHDENVPKEILELTRGGAPHVVEAVGNQESLDLAVMVARPGGTVSFVGVPHNVKTPPMREIFVKNLALRGALAPAREYLPRLIASLEAGRIDPSPVLDAAMDERRAIKVLLEVS